MSGIAVHRGISVTTVSKLQPLESVSDLAYFSKIWLYGGILLYAITFLGFWGADAESRMGLITVITIKSIKIFVISNPVSSTKCAVNNENTLERKKSFNFVDEILTFF